MSESAGNIYVNVVPKVEGSAQAMGQEVGATMGGGMNAALLTASNAAGNIISDAVTKAASAVSDTFKQAFANVADYEQLVGGVETIFKGSADTVLKNADAAFKTAGMSANDYMENVTSFSASLIQSVGGDTEKAAAYADRAMVDMSDNAAKMGTNLESITGAYQSFARGNYGMLDNLKLGYGGTKSEMERLIQDASKMTDVQKELGVEVDASSMSFGNVVNAISVMQSSMGIAGTTMEEGSATISGSMQQLQASWDNLLTSLGSGDSEAMAAAAQNLGESFGAMLQNVIPALGTMASGIVEAVPSIFASVGEAIATQVRTMIAGAFGEGAAEQFDGFLTTVSTVFGEIQSVIGEAVGYIQEAVGDSLPEMGATVGSVMDGIGTVVQTVWPLVKSVVTTVAKAIGAVVRAVFPVIKTTVTNAMTGVKVVMSGLKPIVGVVTGIFNSVKTAITNPIKAAKDTIKGIVDAIKGFFSNFHISIPHIPVPHFAISPAGWQLGDLLKGSIPSLSVKFYAAGGWVDQPTAIAGERGGEFVWPSYGPYLDRYADALTERMGGGVVINMDYNAGDDAKTIVMDIAREMKMQGLAGAW